MLSFEDSHIPVGHTPPADKLSSSSIIFHALHSTSQDIPGNPDLRTHGDLKLVDGGLSFDGQDSHAVAQVPADGCVVNTEKCADGLTFSTKLRFEKEDRDEELRYIVDTGAHNRRMRGFSMFTRGPRLFALVRNADREWMVSFRRCSIEHKRESIVKLILHTIDVKIKFLPLFGHLW